MKIEQFLDKVAEVARPHILAYGYGVLSVILSQGLLECGIDEIEQETGLFPYNNFFGLKCGGAWKGKAVNMSTQEEYEVGTLTDIRDNFRVFDTFEDGVKGYFDFLDWSHYDNLKGITTPLEYVQALKEDGYATSSHYVSNIMNVIENNNLLSYDNHQEQPEATQEQPEVQPEVPQGQNNIYTVKAGDNLSQIAQDYGTTVVQLVNDNNIEDANLIYAGQQLVINGSNPVEEERPCYSTRAYTVCAGDTLSAIASVYDTTVDAITEANGIENVNLIYVGDVLTIPC